MNFVLHFHVQKPNKGCAEYRSASHGLLTQGVSKLAKELSIQKNFIVLRETPFPQSMEEQEGTQVLILFLK
jgi:hypothetical protein